MRRLIATNTGGLLPQTPGVDSALSKEVSSYDFAKLTNSPIPLYNCTTMTKWIATNIRFPEKMYMELKLEAARRRTSVAQIVRERVSSKNSKTSKKQSAEKLMKEFEKVAKENARQNPGVSFSEKLIKMRYEQ